MSRAVETIGPEATQEPDLFRRSMLIGAASALADTGLGSLWSTAVGQPAEQAPVLGRQTLGLILSQPGWDKWIQNGQIAPLYEGEIALLKSIAATPVFGDPADTRARQVVSQVQALQPNADALYITAFLTFAGLQNTNVFQQWHKASYVKHTEKTEYPSGDDPYIWGKNHISPSAAWANTEIGRAVERLELSGLQINSFSKDTGAPTADSIMQEYLFAHYRAVAVRLDGNEKDPAEGSRLAQLMFGRKDITGMLNVVSRSYTNPTDKALKHSRLASKDVSLKKYVTDFQPAFKVLLYGIGKELDDWIASNYRGESVTWGLTSGVRPLSRTSVRIGNLSGNPRNSTHGRGEAADVILAGDGAYQVVEAGRKAWSDALWKTALSRLAKKYGLRHLGPSINDWPHIDINPNAGLQSGGATQLNRWRQTIAQEAATRPGARAAPQLVIEPREVTRPAKQ
jgi:hypothetical protein